MFAESPVVFAERMSVLKEIIKMKKLLWKKKGGEKSVLKKKRKGKLAIYCLKLYDVLTSVHFGVINLCVVFQSYPESY